MNRLEAVGNQAYADYKATSYDRSQVMTIVDSYTATVGAMESECDGGIGTEATRAGIIETVIQRKYAERKGNRRMLPSFFSRHKL